MAQPAALPADEPSRLACLQRLQVLDSTPEPLFDQVAALAGRLCGTPVALVSLVDAQRQWFKANVGLPGANETHRDLAFCAHAILGDGLFEVPDATLDPRFADNALVSGAPHIRFYAGAPIVMAAGQRLGTLCVIDQQPRTLDAVQRETLLGLAALVATALEERRQRLALGSALAASEANYQTIVEGQTELVSLADPDGRLRYANAAYARFFGRTPGQLLGLQLTDLVEPADRDLVRRHLQRVIATAGPLRGVNRMIAADGQERWVDWTNRHLPAQDGRPATIHSVGRDITEQHLAEQRLALAEARQRMLYESTPAMLHSIDGQGRLLGVSDHWLQRLGYSRAQVIGQASSDFLTPESARIARETVLPAFFRTGRCDDVPYQMRKADGSTIDVLLSAVLERDPQGMPLRSLAVLQDVTERNRATTALHESNHLLQLVLDSLPARISYWDVHSRNRFANKAFLDWYGQAQEAIVDRHASEVLGDPTYQRILPPITAGLAGRAGQLELEVPQPDGTRMTTDMRFIPDLREGQVHGLFVFALDISAQRLAERELAAQDRRLRLLVDGVRDYAIYMLDPDGRVATWNTGAQRNLGYTAEQVLGRSHTLFFTAEDIAAGVPDQALAAAARDGEHELEGWRLRSDGSRYWVNALTSALHDDGGRLRGFAKVTRDLTERRRQHAATERALAEKETLLKEVYHRVKNNLQVVQSLLNLQRQALPAGVAHEALRDTVQRVRAMALVHEKLYQSGDLAAIRLPGYTRELMGQIADAHGVDRSHLRLQAQIADIETRLDSAIPYGLLLTELLTNCFKHAFPDGRAGTVQVRLELQDGGALLTVQDDGVGPAAAPVAATAQVASLGLKLAESLARQLGGSLHTSAQDGTTATALLTRL